jgi:hypothetical protein
LVSPNPEDVAVAPFTVERDSAGVLRALADSCLERLVHALTEKGIVVSRNSNLTERNLHTARPVPWTVLGHLSWEHGQYRAELRLLEVESGEEMRSYFNADANPEEVAKLGAAAAARIAAFIEERREAQKSP